MARFTVPGTTVSLLTCTSKMPSKSYSLPAGKGKGGACPSAVYGPNSICGSCYAQKGSYAWGPVKRAQAARMAWTLEAMMTDAGRDAWVAVMTAAIDAAVLADERRHYRQVSKGERPFTTFRPVFRVHDSGDLFSPRYADAWSMVLDNLADVRFWFPTRTWTQIRQNRTRPLSAAVLALSSRPNAVVRPSALYFDETPPVVEGLAAGSGGWNVDKRTMLPMAGTVQAVICPAYKQDGQCLDCRNCWDGSLAISYKRH